MRKLDPRTDRFQRRRRTDGSVVVNAAERIRRHAHHHGCSSGKVGYTTKRKAIVVLEEIRATARKQYRSLAFSRRTEAQPYLCEECNEWHLTSQRSQPRLKAA